MGYTHGKKYSEEQIIKEINDVMGALEINRMPSRSEFEATTKNYSLVNKITRSGGWYYWADKMGLDVKKSDTSKGKHYENICAKDISKYTGLESEQMSQNYPFDLLVDGEIRVDTKASELYETRDGRKFYTFNTQKRYATCDLYVCYCLEKGVIRKTLIIPASKCQVTQLSVGIKSGYDVYDNKWDYFTEYSRFYKSL